jgi:hypothetical protein
MKMPVSILLNLVFLAFFALPVQAAEVCNPVVEPDASDTTLIRLLSRLAEKYEFTLSIPESLDRPVRINKRLPLDRLIKRLTVNMNTVVRHTDVDDCASPVLVELVFLRNGLETNSVAASPGSDQATVDYVYIDDMDSYVTGVIEGKAQPDLERMTPEQRVEYEIQYESKIAQKGAEGN